MHSNDILHLPVYNWQMRYETGEELSPLSALCVTVPGTAAAWEAATERWGKKSLREVLAPAIELAEEGVPVSEGAAEIWKHSEAWQKTQ